MAAVPTTSSADSVTTEFRTRQPRGLWILFTAEMWERFSFYGMRALLTLYMTEQLLMEDERATSIYAAYGTLVYALPVLGGYLADRLLGYRRAIILGGSLMALGHFAMAVTDHTAAAAFDFLGLSGLADWAETSIDNRQVLFAALSLLCIGNGFFKPNISSTVGKLYAPGDPMRDRGFTIFYMGINIGAFSAPLLCRLVSTGESRHWGFTLAGIGMVLGLIVFLWGQNRLEGAGQPPDPERLRRKVLGPLNLHHVVWLACFLAVPGVMLLLDHDDVCRYVLYGVGVALLAYIGKLAADADVVARHRIVVFGILWLFHTAFWALFEQAGSSLTLFAERNVDRTVDALDFTMPTEWSQSINPLFIVLLAPVFTWIWKVTAQRGVEPSIPMKFGLGVTLLALGYIVMVAGARAFAVDGLTPLVFLGLLYLLHTMGELCLSPVGLSAVTKLAPPKAVGFFMGTWFLSISFAHSFAGLIAGETAVPDGTPASASLGIYTGVYWQGGLILVGMGVVLMLISRWVNKLAHGVK